MEICLRRPKDIKDITEPTVDGEQETNEAMKIDDLELADSDREDYHNNVDILFVLDTTGSMGSYIQQSKTTIKKIIEKFSKMEFNIKFSLCAYRDHPPQESTYVTKFYDLVSGKQFLGILATTEPQGGGDGPEAVMDGLSVGLTETTWRLSEDNITPSKRFVFHICDAPPHGEEYGEGSADQSWRKNGCPCGIKKEDINNLLKKHNVDYHLIKATSQIDKMEAVFKECFGSNFSETIQLEKNFSKNDTASHTYSVSSSSAALCRSDIPSIGFEDKKLEELKKSCCGKTLEKEMVENTEHFAPESLSAAEKDVSIGAPKQVYSNMWDGVISTLSKKLA